MSEKSVQKRNYIIEKAREVFSQKGYLTVTMKDIVEACEISRGGLYLYFPGRAPYVYQEHNLFADKIPGYSALLHRILNRISLLRS